MGHADAKPQKMSIGEVLTSGHFASGRRTCWGAALGAEFDRSYMRDLRQYLIGEGQEHAIFPQPERIFEALDETTLDEVKVVILGEDPYPKHGQAHGLAFSVEDGERPTSLTKIFAEVNRDIGKRLPPDHNCLTPWARQGVLLLNTVLTVRQDCPGSHKDRGWERFTDRIVEAINSCRTHVVFMLWGSEAKRKCARINGNRHKILTARHPRIGITGCRHFSRANSYLKSNDIEPVDWMNVCRRSSLEEEAAYALTSADVEDEARWDRAFATSRPVLERLAAEAAEEHRRGATDELDPTRL